MAFGSEAAEQMLSVDPSVLPAHLRAVTEFMTRSYAAEYRGIAGEAADFLAGRNARSAVSVEGAGLVGGEGDRAQVLTLLTTRRVPAGGEETEASPGWALLELLRRGQGWVIDDLVTEDPEPLGEPEPHLRTALDAANGAAGAFLSADHRSVAGYLDRLRPLVTGRFEEDLEDGFDELRSGLRRARSVVEVDVDASAVERSTTTSALVLIVASGTVANEATAGERQHRSYRIRMDLVRTDGEWLVRDLGFVSSE